MYATLKRTFVAAISAVALAGAATCARAADKKKEKPPAAESKDAKKAGQKVDMKVTDKGFEPANLMVKAGQPVTLVITRTTEKTCATDIVIDDYGIKTALPLNKAVEVSFTPKKAGELKYGCAMNKMVGGILRVQ